MTISTGANRRLPRETERPTRIPPEALEVIADILLAAAGRDKEYPAYSEFQLKRKCRNSGRAELHFVFRSATWADILLTKEAAHLVEAAGLSDDQRTAWEMHLAGYTPGEIACVLHVARPTAVRLVNAASRRISTCPSKYRGLYSVYMSQIHRHIYHRPVTSRENRPLEPRCRRREDTAE